MANNDNTDNRTRAQLAELSQDLGVNRSANPTIHLQLKSTNQLASTTAVRAACNV